MNASEVVNKILADGKADAQKIEQEGQKKIVSLKADNALELEKYSSESQRLASKAADDRRLRILATARMGVAKSVLAAKHNALESVFAKAGQDIKGMNDADYLKFISDMIKSSIETGDELVVVGRDETRINDEFIKQLNRELGTGFKGNLMLLADRNEISGGFILKRGDISMNVSLEVLMQMAREELETQIAEELFV